MRYLILIFLLITSFGFSQIKYFEGSIQEGFAYAKKHKQNVFVDVYTDWCHYCKQLDQTTFLDTKVVSTLNKFYVVLKVNAQKEGIRFARQQGVTGYPTMLVMNENQVVLHKIPGFVVADQLHPILLKYIKKPSKTIKKEVSDDFLLQKSVELSPYEQLLKSELSVQGYKTFVRAIQKGENNDYEWLEYSSLEKEAKFAQIGFFIGKKAWNKVRNSLVGLEEYSGLNLYCINKMLIHQVVSEKELKLVNQISFETNGLIALETKIGVEYLLRREYKDTLKEIKKKSKKKKIKLSKSLLLLE